MNPKVNFYFIKNQKWQQQIELLRNIALDCGLTEELKWGCPCYTYNKQNVVLIHVFKDYCALLFFKGVMLKNWSDLMVQQTPNVQVARQARFTDTNQILKNKKRLINFITEARELEKQGVKPILKKTEEFFVPVEFEKRLGKTPSLSKAFKALTPGRQRGYLLYFSQAKQAATREQRIEKCIPKIMQGKGLNDE